MTPGAIALTRSRLPYFATEDPGQVDQRRLGRAVDALGRGGEDGVDGDDVEDRSAAAWLRRQPAGGQATSAPWRINAGAIARPIPSRLR